jgi:hypothetical protein
MENENTALRYETVLTAGPIAKLDRAMGSSLRNRRQQTGLTASLAATFLRGTRTAPAPIGAPRAEATDSYNFLEDDAVERRRDGRGAPRSKNEGNLLGIIS